MDPCIVDGDHEYVVKAYTRVIVDEEHSNETIAFEVVIENSISRMKEITRLQTRSMDLLDEEHKWYDFVPVSLSEW